MNWAVIFNRLLELIRQDGTPNSFSGQRFLRKVRRSDPRRRKTVRKRRDTGSCLHNCKKSFSRNTVDAPEM